MYPHRIRLRGPWQVAEAAGKQTLPWSELSAGTSAGRAARHFGFPGRIDSYERVWLTFDGLPAAADIFLNGKRLGQQDVAGRPFEFEVTSLLQARNELAVELRQAPVAAAGWGEIAMEVRAMAFLRNVRAQVVGEKLRITGEVVGSCERTLELYVLVDNATVHYATVDAEPEGQAFDVIADRLPVHEVRVELVNGASVWYRWEKKV